MAFSPAWDSLIPPALATAIFVLVATPGAQAADPPAIAAAEAPASEAPAGFWERANLLGDMAGLRTLLGDYGISIGLQNALEAWTNATGGIKRGASGDGLATLTLGLDTRKALGWQGGTFNLSLLGIYGPNFSQGYLGNLQTASGIAAAPTVRLWELWYQQAFLDGRMDVKIGQQSLDQEFMVSQAASLFLNTVMGWPMTPTADLYAGGPAYPLSSLGVRLRGHPTDTVTLLGGVFQDNPPGGPFTNDSQLLGATRYGVNMNLRTGALFIAELQVAVNQPNAGTYKIGAWFDTAPFPDPASSGNPRLHWHNFSIYAVADQTVWQPGGGDPRAVSLFVRPMLAPAAQNLIDFSINGGATLKAPLPGRDNDTFGVGFGLANVSSRASAFTRDAAFFSGATVPARGAETFVEVTYQLQVTPWFQVQPDFQYVWMPGGGLANPGNPARRIGNEAVFGLRTNVTF